MTERQLMFGSLDGGIQQSPPIFDAQTSPAVTNNYNKIGAKISTNKNPQLITNYAVKAVQCFARAIQLAEGEYNLNYNLLLFLGSRVEDTLRLLMIWFDHCEKPEVFDQLRDLIKKIPVETWLEVVPQLMGRMDSTKNVGLLVKQVVIDIAKAHPQVSNRIFNTNSILGHCIRINSGHKI
jgi:hypothetical protein